MASAAVIVTSATPQPAPVFNVLLHIFSAQISLFRTNIGPRVSRVSSEPGWRQRCESAIAVHVGLDDERYQQVAVQEPRHPASSSASIRATKSAATGWQPREIAMPFRCPAGAPLSELPGRDRRSSRLTAALMLQSSALASETARA